MFAVIVGADGSGKSTLFDEIKVSLPKWKLVSASPKDLYPHPAVPYMEWTLRTHPREYILHHAPRTRAAFFIQTISILYEYHIAPSIDAGQHVLCDSYYYRFLAKEKILNPKGVPPLESLCRGLPRPDLIINLDVVPEIAFKRKQSLTRFEYLREPTVEDFLDFQLRVEREVNDLVGDVPVSRVNGVRSTEAVRHRVLQILSEKTDPCVASTAGTHQRAN